MTKPTLTDDDWAIMYLAWLNDLPLSDTIWRWEATKKRAEDGHHGSCVKVSALCGLCLMAECLAGGRQMETAWRVEAARERSED